MLNRKKEEPVQPVPAASLKVESGYGEGDVNSYSETVDQPGIFSKIAEDNFNTKTKEENYEEEERDEVLITVPMREMSLQAEETSVNCY